MAIIDSQVHVYEANTPKRSWHTVPNWPDHVAGDEMVAPMDAVAAPYGSRRCPTGTSTSRSSIRTAPSAFPET
jgi:hypothetical protein